jgi:hypothetical protein
MLPLSALSRRTLVAATALVAVAPHAAVATKKKPLAAVLATLSDPVAADGATFGITFQASVAHLASGTTEEFTGVAFVATHASADQMRKQIATGLRDEAVNQLGGTIPPDRISVVLL